MAAANGRVAGVAGRPVAPFQMFAGRGGSSGSAFAVDTLTHVWSSKDVSPATRLFTSQTNLEALQHGIRYRVYVDSGGKHVVGRQSDTELAVVMRSILLQYGENDAGGNALAQVRSLNARVLDFCVPRILSELLAYQHYLTDVSTLPVPLERGQIASTKGDKTLELRSFI